MLKNLFFKSLKIVKSFWLHFSPQEIVQKIYFKANHTRAQQIFLDTSLERAQT